MKRMKALLPVLVVCLLAAATASAGTISLNLSEAANQDFAGGALIGPLQTDSSNWNTTTSATTGDNANGSMTGLVDDSGTVTNVNASWSSSNCWWNWDGTGDDEHKLATGYFDDGGDGYLVTFENIPYAQYKVYGLFASDGAVGNSMECRNVLVNGVYVFGGDDTTAATVYANITDNQANNGEFWTEITDTTIGNYWTITATGSTLTIDGLGRNESIRGSLAGVVIQEVPEPATMALLGLGSLALIRRRKA